MVNQQKYNMAMDPSWVLWLMKYFRAFRDVLFRTFGPHRKHPSITNPEGLRAIPCAPFIKRLVSNWMLKNQISLHEKWWCETPFPSIFKYGIMYYNRLKKRMGLKLETTLKLQDQLTPSEHAFTRKPASSSV